MRRWLLVSAVVVVVFGEEPAWALDPAVNAGAIEVVGLPGPTHLGVYPYLAGSASFPAGKVVLVPGFGVEWSPEFGRWGVAGTFVVDYPLSGRAGLDLVFALLHDQGGGAFSEALFFAGVGVGLSVFFDGGAVVSPSVSVFQGLTVPGWSVVPGLNVAKAL